MEVTLRALLVGIDCYGGRVPALRGCKADVAAMQHLLTAQLGVPLPQVRTLLDAEATRAAIVQAWHEHLLAAAAPGVQLFFHFSGHGSQAPSLDPDEPDGLDESLLAYDSRLPGGSDLLDKEFGYLVRQAEARGAQVSVLLDCCHSGSGTRQPHQAAVRRTAARQEAAAPAALVAPPADLLAAQRTPTAHVTLTAANDDEAANELYVTDGDQWRGCATYFCQEALRGWHPAMTWDEVHDQVLARVRARYPRQSPQLEGPRGQLVFGAGLQPVGAYLRVLQVTSDGRIQIDGGAAAGLAAGAGLAIYRPGTAPPTPPSTLARVETVEAGSAWAQTAQPAVVVAPGNRVHILNYGYSSQVYRVATDDAKIAAQLAAREGPPSSFLRLATGATEPAAFTVEATPAGYQIVDATGSEIGAAQPADDEGAAATVANLEHLAIFANVLLLRNPAPAAALRTALQVVGPQRMGSPSGELPQAVAEGDRIEFQLVNRTTRTLYLAVFRLGADYSIMRIKPEAERTLTLAPGRAAGVRVTDTIHLPGATRQPALVRYKVFVLTERMDLDVLALPPLDGRPVVQAAPTRTGTPLSDLLDGVRRTGARPMRPPASTQEDAWYTLEIDVVVSRSALPLPPT